MLNNMNLLPVKLHKHIFVYGTLKDGFPNSLLNHGLRIPGTYETITRFPLYLVNERYSPWLIDDPGCGHFIFGQVFEVTNQQLAAIDHLERTTAIDGYYRASIAVRAVRSAENSVHIKQVYTYFKSTDQLKTGAIKAGPIREYTHEHASLYSVRNVAGIK